MQSLDYMPLLRKHIIDEGTLYDRHYCTTNVTDVFPPYGGYPKFVQQGLNEDWLPVWLQDLGYNTYYTGKLFNSHSVDNYDDPPVNGFNGSDFLLDPYTYEYYGARMTRNGAPPVSYEALYSPDVVAEKAYGFLDEATEHDEPFFLAVAPIAPHADVRFAQPVVFNMAKYAPRHAHLFEDYKIPRTANFNPDTPSGVSWVKNLPQLNDTVIEYNDEFQRSRLRALQSVDEMVETLVNKLEAQGLLESTYIFYTTDNGYHISQHRMHPGKECPYETDIHIPLVVRGPGVLAGHTAAVVSSHTDLTPTLLKLAGSDRPDLDGMPIPLSTADLADPSSGEHVNVEFWGRAIPEGKLGTIRDDPVTGVSARNNTYKALRVVGEGYNLLYTVWCTGEREYYDLSRDPDQMINYLADDSTTLAGSYTLAGRSFGHVINRLDSVLMVLKSCKAVGCHAPWSVLHPDGDIKTLKDALDSSYDAFYDDQPKVSFSSCEMGYLVDAEGPQHVDVWEEAVHQQVETGQRQQSFKYHGDWSLWT
ncbi:hypothetical protein LTR85_002492 [Meristemomyces frigidus]|nr:hypothetical protein LTR85_002492 [Meristemomyces frigidus]